MDAKEAFNRARIYITNEPIMAEWTSVEPVYILPSGSSWTVTINYWRKGTSQWERAMIVVDSQGEIAGFARI